MWRIRVWLVIVPLAFSYGSQAMSAPPRVVKAVPDNGDVGVDPGLRTIRITFDQAMNRGGMSVVGGGESYPVHGKPRWTTSRTITIPMRLEPDHDYWLSINNERFRNFTSRTGESAVPYPIAFRTGAADGAAAEAGADGGAAGPTPKENRRALNLLRAAMRDHYSYYDRLGIDWNALLLRHSDTLTAAKTPAEFARTAGMILARAHDKHLWFRVDEETIPSYVNPSVPNANFKWLPKLVPGWQIRCRGVASGRWNDGVGYLLIGSWSSSNDELLPTVHKVLEEMQDAPALVIDVRGNGGGAEPLAQQVAGCFVDTPRLYAKHVIRDPDSPGGFTPPHERWLKPNDKGPAYRGRIAVLTGPAVLSSCEAFLLMMKQVPGAVLVGGKSQGASGNPQPYDLENGVTVLLPSWKAMTPDGQEFEGQGIPPDIKVQAAPRDFATADPVLEAALAHLRQPAGE